MDAEIGKEIDLRIERLGIHGEGVGSFYGYTIFVEGALPGEIAHAQIYEKRKNFGRARLISPGAPSSHRVQPVCPLFGKCGGCQLMHMTYAGQLETKRQRVVDALHRIGKLPGCEVSPCQPSPRPLAYRNKIQLPVVDSQLGLYAHNTHDIVPIERCHIHCELGERAFQCIRIYLQANPLEEIRHVLIKTAIHTEQVLVVFVTKHKNTPALTAFAENLMKKLPQIRGVVQNINPSSSNTVLSGNFHTLAGIDHIEESINGLKFKVSPASFFQVNPSQAQKLYAYALECAALQGEEKVLDAYCGVGTLSLIFAEHAKEVIGVECVPAAINDARENALRNKITNAVFHCAPAEEFITTLNEIDVVILNPPRKGCDPSLLSKLKTLKPKKIVYISCDPATLARDLALLCQDCFHLERVQPFDMFPQTAHVETIALLSLS